MFETVAATVLIALSAAGLIQLLRQIPWVQRQMLAGHKPWVCDLCMSWWTSLIAGAAWCFLDGTPGKAIFPAFALTLLVTHILGAPTSEYNVEDIPELEEPELILEHKP